MTDERANELIAAITLNQLCMSDTQDRKIINRLQHENYSIQQALAIEYGARHGWKYITSPVEYLIKDSILTMEDINRKEFIIKGGRAFNCRMLSEGKKANNYWRPEHDIDPEYMDHPYFYKDKEYRAVAIIAHSYNMPNIKIKAEKFAKEKGLIISYPDFPSWWYPGWTTIIQYTGGTII